MRLITNRILLDPYLVKFIKECKNNIDYEYSCVMVLLPDNLAQEIMSFGKKNIPNDNVFDEKDKDGRPKYGRENQMHVTVKYGLLTSEVDDIKKVVGNFGKIEVTLGKISKFTSKDKYDVVKIEVISPDLIRLNKALNRLENNDEYKDYKAHVTLSYVNKGSCKELVGNREFEGRKFVLDEVQFSPAQGEKTKIKTVKEKSKNKI